MLWGVHIAVPVLGAAVAARLYQIRRPLWAGFTTTDYVLVALAAILPDILDPHVYLTERMASMSHTAHFVVVMAVLLAVALRRDPWLWGVMTAALIFHLGCDACSGGIPLWRPWLQGAPVGAPYIPEKYWIPADLVAYTGLAAFMAWRRHGVPLAPIPKK